MGKSIVSRLPWVAAAAIIATWTLEASAQATLKVVVDNCQNRSLKPDDRIDACSDLLRSGLLTHKFKAAFLVDRAMAYMEKNDNADALVDLNQAVEYDPNYVAAQDLRNELDPQHADAAPKPQ